MVTERIRFDIASIVGPKTPDRGLAKPNRLRISRIGLWVYAFGLQVQQGQPQSKGIVGSPLVVLKQESAAHDAPTIDENIVKVYLLGAGQHWRRVNALLALSADMHRHYN